MRKLNVITFFLLLTAPVCGTADSSSAPETEPSIAYGRKAKPIERPPPHYPGALIRRGQEGWVELSYVVGTDGLLYDPIIEDSSGIRGFEREALQIIKKWRFDPATWKGKPVEQAHTKVRIVFAIEGSQDKRGATRKFIRRDKKFNRLLEEGNLEAAKEWLNASFEESSWNLYETSRLWLSSYLLQVALSNDAGQLRSIQRASAGRDYLRPETAIELLRIQFAVEARLGRFSDALDTYELLVSEAPTMSEDDPLSVTSRRIRDLIDGDQVIAAEALLESSKNECCDGTWWHQLLRHKFSIDNIDGEVEAIDFRCDWRRASESEIYSGKIWEIPASWGNCRLYVHGSEGTTFRLLELSDEYM